MREKVNIIYSDVKEVCDQVGVKNSGESTLAEKLSNMEHISHTNIYQRLQDIQAGVSS